MYTHTISSTTQYQDYAAVGLSGVACIKPSTTAANGFAADESGYASKNDLHERAEMLAAQRAQTVNVSWLLCNVALA